MIIIKQRCIYRDFISLDFAVIEHDEYGYNIAAKIVQEVIIFQN